MLRLGVPLNLTGQREGCACGKFFHGVALNSKSDMKIQSRIVLIALTLIGNILSAGAQGTAFTYQGKLNNGGSPANGLYDFRFRLASDALGNNLVGGPYLTNGILVTNGLFMTTLDFGAGVFNGSNYWLEVDVKTNLAGGYTALSPLQAILATPYAVFAGTASNLSGTVSAGQLSGTLPSGQLGGAYSSAVVLSNAANSFSGNGSGLSGVNASALGGLNSSNFWQLTGNAVSAGQFLGSTNNQAVEVVVNGTRGLRIEPNASRSPNVIGGSFANLVGAGVSGAVIAGGGSTNIGGGVYSNAIFASYGNINGGLGNLINTNASAATIGGGILNVLQSGASSSFIGGGGQNLVDLNSDSSVIGGGQGNSILSQAWGSTLLGGESSQIGQEAHESFIGGGTQNIIGSNSFLSVIVGGNQNFVLNDSQNAVIGGGGNNGIGVLSTLATIAGGGQNVIGSNSYQTTISGGLNNRIEDNALNSSIAGGGQNIVRNGAYDAVIGGGEQNVIYTNAGLATIGGGVANFIQSNSVGSVIGGGSGNVAMPDTSYSVIGGGTGNTNAGSYSTIPGGNLNAAGPQSFAAGHRAKALATGAFVWADSNEADFSTTANNQFLVRAAGGVGINTNNPQAALHVSGNFMVSGGDVTIPAASEYRYATAKTHYYSVQAMTFVPESSTYAAGTLNGNIYLATGSAVTVGYLDAPVNLPDGSTVTSVTYSVVDNDGTYNLQTGQLWRVDGSTSTSYGNSSVMATIPVPASSNSTLVQTCTTSSISNATIDNQNYAYWLRWGTQQANSNMRLVKVVIAYTVTKAD